MACHVPQAFASLRPRASPWGRGVSEWSCERNYNQMENDTNEIKKLKKGSMKKHVFFYGFMVATAFVMFTAANKGTSQTIPPHAAPVDEAVQPDPTVRLQQLGKRDI